MTLTCDIWIAADDQARLMGHLYPGDNDEHAAVLRAGIVETSDGLRLLVQHIELAIDGRDCVPGTHGYHALTPSFIHKQIIQCRNERLAYLSVHNHDCDDSVAFSRIDIESHERGYPALRDIGKGVPVGALVFGRHSVEADIWMPDGRRARLGEFRAIGPTIKRLYSSPRRAPKGFETFDRQVRMFGATGQAVLAKAKVAVIGLGGVGSIVNEHVARLGVGHLLLIDHDRIEDTNLARVVGATVADVLARRFKTSIAARQARLAQPDIKITEITRDVVECDVAQQLRDCDYVFLCADSMRARLLTNAIAHQYFVPMVQLGAKVQPDKDGVLVDATSVIRSVRPGQGCLWCNGFIPSGELALESKSDEERKAQAYGTNEPNPSVITLNAIAAAHGLNDFLFDFLDLRPRADGALYNHFHFVSGKLSRTVPRREATCSECVDRFGRGDAIALPCVPPQPGQARDWLARLRALFSKAAH